jgi:hypothetical protein
MRKAKTTGAGVRANDTKIAAWGPDEPNRAAREANWTIKNGSRDPENNPHLRIKIYPKEDHDRVKRFNNWRKANPGQSHDLNPYSWAKAHRSAQG